MSLYIGNLSARTRRDDLENVFRRFGRCNVKLKDGYGFVVYDFFPNAQKALRALQGRNICGQPLTLTWSNQQPKAAQRFVSGARFDVPKRVKSYKRGGNYFSRKMDSKGHKDYGTHEVQPDGDGQRLNSSGVPDEGTSYHQYDDIVNRKHHDFREDLRNDDGFIVPNQVDNDRWGEQVNEISRDHGLQHGPEYERYDPLKCYDSIVEEENHVIHLGSLTRHNSQEKVGWEQFDGATLSRPIESKSKLVCYNCGGLGHKMLECPKETASEKWLSSIDREDGGINTRDKGDSISDRSTLKLQEKRHSSRTSRSRRELKSERKETGSEKNSSLVRSGSSPFTKDSEKSWRRDNDERKHREINGDSRRENAKRARVSVSAHCHSKNSASRTHSDSHHSKSVPVSEPHIRSRSLTPVASSVSLDSRSTSLSYGPHHSMSRSGSSTPRSLPLPVPLGEPKQSSPSKKVLEFSESLGKATNFGTKDILVEQGQAMDNNLSFHNTELENADASVNDETVTSSCNGNSYTAKNQPLLIATAEAQNINPNAAYFEKDNLTKDVHLEKYGKDNPSMTGPSCEAKISISLLEKSAFSDRSSTPESTRGKIEPKKSDSVIGDKLASAEMQDSDQRASASACCPHSMSLSPEEMCMVLKHYGMELPDKNEKDLPVDMYFGSARLWPWEIIYYRRLKKGPVSVENYERRVAQNKEFGIVDKYIRSSSGWWEPSDDKS